MIPEWLKFEFARGAISFEHFMGHALYQPRNGYYTSGIKSVGRGGDFSTSATISNALAQAVTTWIVEEVEELGLGRPFHFIELGPGDGSLALGVLNRLPWTIRRFCRFHFVEISNPLRALQAKKLKKYAKHLSWHFTLPGALQKLRHDCHPFIYSNEFFDAFPIRIFRNDEELYLSPVDGTLLEEWRPVKSLPPSSVFSRKWPAKQRLEVSPAAEEWLDTSLPNLECGSMLTIDYGGSPKEIYHRRPLGTIRGYFLQQMLTGPALYENPGLHDLTADVNFNDLRRSTESHGLKTLGLITQADFLAPFLDDSSDADRFLSDTMGAGEAFKVLIQRKIWGSLEQ